MNGIHLPLERLYPAVSYSVSRGTQIISPMILWDHSLDWYSGMYWSYLLDWYHLILKCFHLGEYDQRMQHISCQKLFIINIADDDSKYMRGHIIDGKLESLKS